MAIDNINALVDLGNIKSYLGIAETDTEFDTDLDHLIDAVSWYFNNETNRKLKARDYAAEYYDGDGSDTLYVENYPINSITHLYIDTERAYGADDEILAADYMIYKDMGKIIVEDTVFSKGNQSVKLEYNGGYATIPYDLENACKEMVAFLFKRDKAGNRIGVKSLSVEGGSENYVTNMPDTVKQVLRRFWRPNG